jgi:raffinose/stachyose/melibiose transport system permease protein
VNRYTTKTLGLELVMIVVTGAFLFPIYIALMVALKTPHDLAVAPLTPPWPPRFDNFATVWAQSGIAAGLLGSGVIVLVSVVIQIVVGAPAGYALARRLGRMSNVLYLLFMFGLILPPQLGLIPLFQTIKNLHLVGTYFSLLLVYAGSSLPFTVFLFTGFIRVLPTEYEYAAFADGASRIQAFSLVVFPLLRPVIGTVVILDAIGVWNDFLTPLLFLGGSTITTVPLAVYSYVDQYTTQWNLLFAAMLVGILPILGAFVLLQRYVIRGFVPSLK